MKNVNISLVVVQEEGQIQMPSWVQQQCDMQQGDHLLLMDECGAESGLFLGVRLLMISPSALARRFQETEKALDQIDGA